MELQGKKVIGASRLQLGDRGFSRYSNSLNFITVDPMYQSRGIGTKLLELCFQFAKEKDISLLFTGYSLEGYNRIRKKAKEIASMYSVQYKDYDKVEFPIPKHKGPRNGDYKTHEIFSRLLTRSERR